MKAVPTKKGITLPVWILAVIVMTWLAVPVSVMAKETLMVPANFSDLAEKARPGVVNIRTEKISKGGGPVFRHFFGDQFREFFGPPSGRNPNREFKQRSLGSGFLIDRKGYIVTNNHVIEGASSITVRLYNDEEFEAELIGRDPKTDLALIKIKADSSLKPLYIGDSDRLKVGSWVVAIGSPFGLEQTVTAGIVSAKGRIIGSGPYDDFIQTDASINPGNSGGPLLNLDGEVVGINTAIVASGQGIGFAIPVSLAAGIIEQLKSNGEVERGWLGVGIQTLTPEMAEYYHVDADTKGVLVGHVYRDEPADRAGIRVNDIVTHVAGIPVTDSRELSRAIADSPVGKKTVLTVLRDGKKTKIAVKLAKRPEDESQLEQLSDEKTRYGMELDEMSEKYARYFGHPEDEEGLVVTAVDPEGKAYRAGIRIGDLIKEVDRQPITSIRTYEKVMDKKKDGDDTWFLIKKPQGNLKVVKIGK